MADVLQGSHLNILSGFRGPTPPLLIGGTLRGKKFVSVRHKSRPKCKTCGAPSQVGVAANHGGARAHFSNTSSKTAWLANPRLARHSRQSALTGEPTTGESIELRLDRWRMLQRVMIPLVVVAGDQNHDEDRQNQGDRLVSR